MDLFCSKASGPQPENRRPPRRLIPVGKWALAVAGLCLPTAALCEITRSAPGRYVCQAGAGEQDRTDISDFFTDDSMLGSIRILGTESDAEGESSAGLAFIFPDGKVVAVHLIASADEPRRAWVGLVHPGNDRVVYLGSLRRARAARILMRLDAHGELHVYSDMLSTEVTLGEQRPIRRELFCTSGNFQIQLYPPPRG